MVFHSPFPYGVPLLLAAPAVATLHDAILPGKLQFDDFKNCLSRKIAMRKAKQIITVSNYSKTKIVNCYKISEDKIKVIYSAANNHFTFPLSKTEKDKILKDFNINGPFFFYVGGYEARKNISFLLRAFASAKIQGTNLVLANLQVQNLLSLANSATLNKIRKNIIVLPHVSEKQLTCLYQSAHCFVYPSLEEGFGLQLCEAMAANCPILAANNSCFPEIAGTGADFFNTTNESELVQKLERLINDSAYHFRLKSNATQKSTQYSWEKTAEQTVKVYEDMIK